MENLFLKFINKFTKFSKVKKRVQRGITPIIATIMILALVVAGVVIGFDQIMPYIERSKVETDTASIQASLISVDNSIWSMISDSAGSYIADSYPSRRMQLTVDIGSLSVYQTSNNVTFEPFLCSGNCTPDAIPLADFNNSFNSFSTDTYGIFSHIFSTSNVLLPDNTLEYLTGSNPYQRRDPVSYVSLTSSVTDEQSVSNISMYRNGYTHYIDLSYRPKIFVTQTIINNNPTYNINIFLIKIVGTTSFVGTANMFLKYSGSTIKQTTLTGHVNDGFSLLMSVDGNIGTYAVFNAAPGGFTTIYRVTSTVQTFTISG